MSPFARRLDEARRLHAGGQVAAAARVYTELRRIAPNDPAVLHPMGVALVQLGRMAEGETLLLLAVDLAPHEPQILFDVAALRDAQGRPGEAEKAMRRVVEVSPDHVEGWAAIGMLRQNVGDRAAAAEAYARAAALAPARTDLALQAAELMEPEAGAALLIERLGENNLNADLLLPLAELLARAGRMDEAEATLRNLTERRPGFGASAKSLGALYLRMGRLSEATAALEDAVRQNPQDASAWTLLAGALDRRGDLDRAIAAADRAVDLRPDDLDGVGLRGRLQQAASRIEEAHASLDRLPKAVRATSEARLLRGMLMPPILDSNEQIDALRLGWMEAMADVAARPTFVARPWETIKVTGYYLGYHGREDRPLMEALACASLAASPHLAYAAPQLGGGGEKIRVGFVSANLRQHSVGRVLLPLIAALDRRRFEVVLFALPAGPNSGQELGEAAVDRTVRLVRQLETDRAAVEAERPDVLIYPDLHLDAYADALSFSRLAPVQATTWGHPGTSGRESLDYWISCEDWEPEGAERFYTERLVRLPRPPFVYSFPTLPERPRDRASFGLHDDARLYGCLQSPFKLHPDFDAILARILADDPEGRIVLVKGPHPHWEERLRVRFARSFDPLRVDFLPPVPRGDYLAAVLACDAMLDPIHFGGGNTTLEALSVGKPVVTLRGDQMRNRATGGFYRQLGDETLVAQNTRTYADLARRVAQEPAYANERRERILAGKAALFDNPAPVAVFEAWLEKVAGGV